MIKRRLARRGCALIGSVIGLAAAIAVADDPPPPNECCPPRLMGAWSPAFTHVNSALDVHAEHMILLKTGKVMLIDELFGPDRPVSRCQLFSPDADNPENGSFGNPFDGPSEADTGRLHDLPCSGHSQLKDGSVLFVGGTEAYTTIYKPDPAPNGQWVAALDCPAIRYYPTCTTLQDGKVLAMAGWCWWTGFGANTPMIFDPNPLPGMSQWSSLERATYCDYRLNCTTNNFNIQYFPFDFMLSSGKVLISQGDDDPYELFNQSSPRTRLLNHSTGSWSDVSSGPEPFRGESAVMYRPDRIMRAGGEKPGPHSIIPCPNCPFPPISPGQNGHWCPNHCGFDEMYVDTAEVATMNAETKIPEPWRPAASLRNARANFYLIVLPDGQVLAAGGTKFAGASGSCPSGSQYHQCGEYVYVPELYNPDDPYAQWRNMNPHAKPRGYHSTAVLLPDARVLMAGHRGNNQPATAEIYSPPYLFTEHGSAQRPLIQEVLGADDHVIKCGTAFKLVTENAPDISKVSLVGLGAATHSFDHNQRFVPLEFELSPPDILYVASPAHACIAPPGYYMLFIVDRDGVPSKAAMVKLE